MKASPIPEALIINVDDNEPSRYAKSRILRQAGFHVHDAATGEEGIELVKVYHPDLVLLDVNLPDIHGIEVCRRVKGAADSASVIVLQISASAVAAPQATAALNSGADAYLTEPVDPEVLVATVRAMLRLRKVERDLAEANSSLEALNKDLRRSNDDLQHFAFLASHDLQEPLRTVTSYAQLIEKKLSGRLTEDELTYFGFIKEGVGRMRDLIDDLLRYAQAGREVGVHYGEVDLGGVVGWAIENLAQPIVEARADIQVGALPVVLGDFGQLGHVIQNLLSNAIKYRNPNQPLAVAIESERDSPTAWAVSVRDNGIGIAPEYHERIFAPFKRLHGREIPGTGIGLALCRRIIENQGGRIWVKSGAGQGSTFSFTIPAVQAASMPELGKSSGWA